MQIEEVIFGLYLKVDLIMYHNLKYSKGIGVSFH
jgi:hypothetical protein